MRRGRERPGGRQTPIVDGRGEQAQAISPTLPSLLTAQDLRGLAPSSEKPRRLCRFCGLLLMKRLYGGRSSKRWRAKSLRGGCVKHWKPLEGEEKGMKPTSIVKATLSMLVSGWLSASGVHAQPAVK